MLIIFENESWVLQNNAGSSKAVEMKSLQKICEVTLADRFRNTELREELRQ